MRTHYCPSKQEALGMKNFNNNGGDERQLSRNQLERQDDGLTYQGNPLNYVAMKLPYSGTGRPN